MPYHAHATLCHGLEKSLSEQHGCGMACESNTAALRKSNGKDAIKTRSSTAWEWHGVCELAFINNFS
jgi:hypothetical protein